MTVCYSETVLFWFESSSVVLEPHKISHLTVWSGCALR